MYNINNIKVKTKDNLTLYVNTKGDKNNTPIILIPGFMQSTTSWLYQFRDKQLYENYYLISYDPRGHGRSSMPDDSDSYSAILLSEDLNSVIKYLNLNKKPILISWSYGGLTISTYLKNFGHENIAGIILMASIISFNIDSVKNHLTEELVNVLPYVIETNVGTDKVNSSILKFIDLAAESNNITNDIYYMLAGQAMSTTLLSRKCLLSLYVNNDEYLKTINIPTLLIWGEKDNHIKLSYCDYIKTLIPHANVIKFPDCGHTVQIEKHNEFNNKICNFVKNLIKQ